MSDIKFYDKWGRQLSGPTSAPITNKETTEYKLPQKFSVKAIMALENKNFHLFDEKTGKTFSVPAEMLHFVSVLAKSIESGKRQPDDWLNPDGDTMGWQRNLKSIKNHWKALKKGEAIDADSGLHHALAVACRALMLYTRDCRNINHTADKETY